MKEKIIKTIGFCLRAMAVISLIFCLGFAAHKQGDVVCKTLDIDVSHKNGDYFVSKEDVLRIMEDAVGNQIGKKSKEINLKRIEEVVEKEPHIANAEVYLTLNGELVVKVMQKKAIARIINTEGDSYYLDDMGFVMPLSEIFAARVPIFTGNITEPENLFAYRSLRLKKEDKLAESTILDDIYRLSNYIASDSFFKSQVQQVIVDSNAEFTIIPTLGNQLIFFGNAEDIEGKFKKLLNFYTEGLNKTGWNKYATINLKFKNQVVCTKKDIPLIPIAKSESQNGDENNSETKISNQ